MKKKLTEEEKEKIELLNLNIFKVGYYHINNFSTFINNIKNFFRNIKRAYQRCTRGFSDYDMWDLDIFLTKLLANSLDNLADNCHGWPSGEEFKSYEDWKEYLRNTSELFKRSLEDYYYKNEYQDDIDKTFEKITFDDSPDGLGKIMNKHLTPEEEKLECLWIKEYKNIDDKRLKDLNEALDKLKAHFWNLWD